MDLRRRGSHVIALLAALMALSLVAPSAASAAPTGYAISTKGLTAEAVFSTMPATGPVPGEVYTDTYVFAADQATRFDGERYQEDYVFLQETTYTYDEAGNWVYLNNRNGFAAGDAVTFGGTKNLSTATVTGTIPMSVCDALGCTDGGTSALMASFSGSGDTVRVADVFHVHSASFVLNSRNIGSRRDAAGTATVDGQPLGRLLFGTLFSGSSSERYISLDRL